MPRSHAVIAEHAHCTLGILHDKAKSRGFLGRRLCFLLFSRLHPGKQLLILCNLFLVKELLNHFRNGNQSISQMLRADVSATEGSGNLPRLF